MSFVDLHSLFVLFDDRLSEKADDSLQVSKINESDIKYQRLTMSMSWCTSWNGFLQRIVANVRLEATLTKNDDLVKY